MNEVVFDNQTYIAPSWEDMGQICFTLAKQVMKEKVICDRLIALAKGGLTWSRTMADYLDIDKLSVTHIKFYTGIGKTGKQPVIIQSLPVSVENEYVILFDDVVDSGETLKIAHDYLKMCGAKGVKTVTLFTKSWAKYHPDFYHTQTDAWIIFPHEIRETIELISKTWHNSISREEMVKRFLKLGLPKDQVRYFLKI